MTTTGPTVRETPPLCGAYTCPMLLTSTSAVGGFVTTLTCTSKLALQAGARVLVL